MLLTIDRWWASEHQFLPNLSIRWSNLILIFSPARSEDISDFVKSLNHFYSKLVAFYRKDRSSSRFELTSTWPTFIRFELQDILNSSCRWYDVEQIHSSVDPTLHYHRSLDTHKILGSSRFGWSYNENLLTGKRSWSNFLLSYHDFESCPSSFFK